MTEPKERRVALPGVELHLRDAGTGSAVVLLHGWPQHGGMWAPFFDTLAAGHRVLAPDLRGFGLSEAPPGDYAKHTLARDVLALLDVEGIGKATIVGHDWGGWIAWLLALEHPQRVERFAALDVPPPSNVGVSLTRLPQRLLYGSYQLAVAAPLLGERLVGSRRAVRAFIRAGSSRDARLDSDLLEGYARLAAQPAVARASVALYRTFLLRELPRVLRGTYTASELEVPGLVVMGAESAITKMVGVPRERPGLRVEVLEGVGHFLVDEAPAELLALLDEFLS